MRSDLRQSAHMLPQASFADLLFSGLPENPSEMPASSLAGGLLPSVPLDPTDSAFFPGVAYTLPNPEAWQVAEGKERGKWKRGGKAESEAERETRLEAQRSKADAIHATVKTGLEELASSLTQGKSEPLTAFLDSLARFHHYSWGNTLLIALQRPDATLVAGFTTWKELDRHVKAGEAGIAILAPLARRLPKESDEGNEGNGSARNGAVSDTNLSGGAELKLTGKTPAAGGVWGFKAVYVFDVSQTEGAPLPTFAAMQGDPTHFLPRLRALIAAEGITLDYRETLDGAFGRSCGGSIVMQSGLPGAQEFAVLLHEFAHELLHPPALRADIPRVVRETEAEAVAYVVGRAVGLEVGTASWDYIHLNGGTVATLAASLERIQKTATRILAPLKGEKAL